MTRPPARNPGKRVVTEDTIAAIVADYAAGMSTLAVARKYGVSSAGAHRYVKAAGINRSHVGAAQRAKERREAEYALTGGRWVPNARGVLVWQEEAA